MTPTPYRGSLQSRTTKTARYSFTSGGHVLAAIPGSPPIRVASVEPMADLYELVTAGRGTLGLAGAAFALDEHRNVLVRSRTAVGSSTFVLGRLLRPLRFVVDGVDVGPTPPTGMLPGAPWPGPIVGSVYRVGTGATEISFDAQTRPEATTTIRLSSYVSTATISHILRHFVQWKPGGGQLIVNEAGAMLVRATTADGETGIRYVGDVDLASWFPDPTI